MRSDWRTAPVTDKQRAVLQLFECAVTRPMEVDAELIDAMRSTGLDTHSITEVATVLHHFTFVNRLSDALDFGRPDAKQRSRFATIMGFAGRRVRPTYAEPVWVTTADGHIRPAELQRSYEQLQRAAGRSSHAQRQAVDHAVASFLGASRASTEPLAPAAECFFLKLARHAYRLTDEDYAAVAAEGVSDAELFELIVVGAFSASLVSVEQVFAALFAAPTTSPPEAS